MSDQTPVTPASAAAVSQTQPLPKTLDFDGTPVEIIDHDGAPWLTLSQIVRALGFDSDTGVQNLYTRNRAEFTPDMTALLRQGRTRVRIFSPRGAHLIGMFARTPRAKAFRRWVLDVLDHQAPPAPPKHVESGWPKLLPEPPDPITPEVRRAIHRKAYALSQEAFEHNREYLEDWLRGRPDFADSEEALRQIHRLDLDHGQYLVVNYQDLWALTSWVATLERHLATGKDIAVAMQQATGRRLLGGTA